MIVAVTRAELAAALHDAPAGPKRAFVPTMGALHEGHASLIRQARLAVGLDGCVVVSIFVNPRQFGPNEDLSRYPRPIENDLALLADLGVDVVWTPTVNDMYPPDEPLHEVHADERGSILEGASRPGHFDGVLTVVNLLFDLIRPGIAVFGEKDFQQLVLIRSLAAARGDVQIVAGPLVRDTDGLALSSRNAYLTPESRAQALVIPELIGMGQDLARAGAPADLVAQTVEVGLLAAPGVEPDYVVVTDDDLGAPKAPGHARILIAARVGGVRLLDNAALDLQGEL